MPSPMTPLRGLLLSCGLLMSISMPVLGQTLHPGTEETLLPGSLPGDQTWPQVDVTLTHGGFLVWQDNTIDSYGFGIAAQRLDAGWNLLGSPFPISQGSKGDQGAPSVTMLESGNSLFVWETGKAGLRKAYARFLGADGKFLTGDIELGSASIARTNKYSTMRWVWRNNSLRRQTVPYRRVIRSSNTDYHAVDAVAMPDGGAVVVYSAQKKLTTNVTQWVPQVTYRQGHFYTNSVNITASTGIDSMHDVLLQRFSSGGRKAGNEILLNQAQLFNQREPRITRLANGSFVVVWTSEQEFASPLSARFEWLLNSTNVAAPSTLFKIMGENRIVVSARMLDAEGMPIGDEFRVDGNGPAICANPDVNALPEGNFVVAWSQKDSSNRTNGWNVYSRVFYTDGSPRGPARQLNLFVRGDQFAPRMASIGSVQLAVWTSFGQDGSGPGIYGRLLARGDPTGPEIQVNTTTRFAQKQPAVLNQNGRFAVIWSHYAGVANAMDLRMRTFELDAASAAENPLVAGDGSGPSSLSATAAGSGNVPAGANAATLSTATRVAIQARGNKISLTWNVQAGVSYQLQISTNFSSWANLGPPRTGGATADTLSLEAENGTKFYRVVRVP